MDRFCNHASFNELLAGIADEIRAVVVQRDVADALADKVLGEVRIFFAEQVSHLDQLVKIGRALSAEKDIGRLFEMIVSEAQRYCNADGGTLYIRNDARDALDFVVVRNDTLGVRMGGGGDRITWPAVPLRGGEGKENHRNVSAHCALVGKAVNIADVYCAEGFDFDGTKEYDAKSGYRSRSMLLVPLRDHEDEVVGVLQLLNAKDRKSGRVGPFPEEDVGRVMSLASQAAIALTKMRLIGELENLLMSFLQVIAHAIDEKSPYTSGHILRVAELTEQLVELVNGADEGRLADVCFCEQEVAEIRMAAWMHDIGKITTPEHVIDKGTKLETIHDRIELVRHRVEILKRDAEIHRLRTALAKAGGADTLAEVPEHSVLDDQMAFLEKVNIGGEFLPDASIERVKSLADLKLSVGGREIPLLSEEEIMNLIVRRGTLTDEELHLIRNHVQVTMQMLERLPFPKKLARVPLYAGMHHEALNGRGYPEGLMGEDVPLAARMLAVADVFEALTAADRPYKRGKKMSEAVWILERMVEEGHLDGDLCDLFVRSGLVMRYAQEFLEAGQWNDFEWRGQRYSLGKSGDAGKP